MLSGVLIRESQRLFVALCIDGFELGLLGRTFCSAVLEALAVGLESLVLLGGRQFALELGSALDSHEVVALDLCLVADFGNRGGAFGGGAEINAARHAGQRLGVPFSGEFTVLIVG